MDHTIRVHPWTKQGTNSLSAKVHLSASLHVNVVRHQLNSFESCFPNYNSQTANVKPVSSLRNTVKVFYVWIC